MYIIFKIFIAASTVSATDTNEFYRIKILVSGNIWTAGIYKGSADFGNSVTINSVTSALSYFLLKFNSSGIPQLAITLSAVSNSVSAAWYISDIEYMNGYIYTVGYIAPYTYTFSPGISVTGLGTPNGMVIVKFDENNGNAIWAKTFSNGSVKSIGNSIKKDINGFLWVSGYLIGTGTYQYENITITGDHPTLNTYFLMKIDSNGLPRRIHKIVKSRSIWAQLFTGKIQIDNSFDSPVLYMAGYMNDTLGLGMNISASTNATVNSVFLAKFKE